MATKSKRHATSPVIRTTKRRASHDSPLAAVAGRVEGKFEMVGRIESGLTVVVVDELAADLALPAAAVRRLAKISASTFNRRQKAGRLSPEESDRVYRLRLILDKTTAFFEGDAAAARQWLARPAPALDGLRPIDLLVNEAGVREVEALLGRLDYGVFT